MTDEAGIPITEVMPAHPCPHDGCEHVVYSFGQPSLDEHVQVEHTLPLLDAVMHSVWLHGNWRYLTKQMTTEEKEAAWAAVLRHDALTQDEDIERLDPNSPAWAWWRE